MEPAPTPEIDAKAPPAAPVGSNNSSNSNNTNTNKETSLEERQRIEKELFEFTEEEKKEFQDSSHIREYVEQYAGYMDYSKALQEELETIENQSESSLAKLDEFHVIIDTVRTESSYYEKELIPQLLEKSVQLEKLFAQIDEIEKVVKTVRKGVDKMDNLIEETDRNYSSNTIDRMLGSIRVPFFGKKQPKFVSVIPPMPKWVEPEPIGVDAIFAELRAKDSKATSSQTTPAATS